MKTTIVILGLLFGVLAVWALVETFRAPRKSAPKSRLRVARPTIVDPDATVPPAHAATDPYGIGKLRRGERDTLPPGRKLR